jgi:hypothetical protein
MLNDLMSINAGQMSALANAIEDALAPFGLSIYEAAPRPSMSHGVATACQSSAVAPTGHHLALQSLKNSLNPGCTSDKNM